MGCTEPHDKAVRSNAAANQPSRGQERLGEMTLTAPCCCVQDADVVHTEDRVDPVEDLEIIHHELRLKDIERMQVVSTSMHCCILNLIDICQCFFRQGEDDDVVACSAAQRPRFTHGVSACLCRRT